ncbi:MAG: Hsp20/alpha crystallin family protein [Ignavibacteria bacterium]|nr:Hsp20/alpha crystallin family protein [Ignavibacteria bacterium]
MKLEEIKRSKKILNNLTGEKMNFVKINKDTDILNDTFKSIMNSPLFQNIEKSSTNKTYIPKVRISEDKDNFNIRLELPGMTKEDVKISVENNELTVSGNKKEEKRTEETNLIINEIYSGEFSRKFNVSNDIKIDAIEAEYTDGVLNITLPKIEEAKPVVKEINIK